LVDLGEQIVTRRLKLIETINRDLTQTYAAVAGHDKQVTIKYESSIDPTNYSTNLLQKLESSLQLDMARGFTGSGPHRDDFVIYFGEQPALLSASRGEVRTLLLSLKTLELQVLERERGVRPLLLLDDVFSELDSARRRSLTEYLQDYQVIITTTDADSVIEHFSGGYNVIAIQPN
jgi:DNA replication and repair protein RecF